MQIMKICKIFPPPQKYLFLLLTFFSFSFSAFFSSSKISFSKYFPPFPSPFLVFSTKKIVSSIVKYTSVQLGCHCTAKGVLCSVYFSAQPNKLRPILKFEFCYPNKHIFAAACSSVRKVHVFTFL